MQRFGDAPRAGRRYRRRIGIYAVCLRDGQVLTTLQTGPRAEIQLPGGGIDPGEHPATALHREVREETGWRIALGPRLGAYRRFTFMPDYDMWAEKICLIHLARPTLRTGPPTEPHHHALWLPVADALDGLASDGDRAMLAYAVNGSA